MPMTLNHRTETLWRWFRICDQQVLAFGIRKVHAATAMDWDKYPHSHDVLYEAGYCLDRP